MGMKCTSYKCIREGFVRSACIFLVNFFKQPYGFQVSK